VAFYYGKCFFATVATNSHQLIGPRHPYVKSLQPPNSSRNTSLYLVMHFIHLPVAVGCNFNLEFQPSELFKGVLDEIASVTCQLA